MTEKPDLEKILEIIIKQVDSSEKPLVELYLKNPDALSPEYREKAAGILKQFLSKYPEFSARWNIQSEKAKPEALKLIEYRQEILTVKGMYETWRDSISDRMCNYKTCCQMTMQKYVTAIDMEICEMTAKISQVAEIEEKCSSGKLDKVDLSKWPDYIQEKREKMEKMQKNYQRNTFFLKEESKILTFFKETTHRDPDFKGLWDD